MLDLKLMRQNPDAVVEGVRRRGDSLDMTPFLDADRRYRELTVEIESLQQQRNEKSKAIGQAKRKGEDAEALMAEVNAVKEKIDSIEADHRRIAEELDAFRAGVPPKCLQFTEPPNHS